MSDTYDYGPLQSYEITWSTGHVEVIQAHQVSWPDNMSMFRGVVPETPRVMFHGEFLGHWYLVLQATETDISRIRNVSITEPSLSED